MDNLRKLQLLELDILKKTLIFFQENNIDYFALGGTVLGAIRHEGFIPWDDDIDLGVPREDYERLLGLKDQLPSPLTLKNYLLGNKEYMYYFSRIEDPRIQVVSTKTEIPETICAWVDIFPLDGMPNRVIRRKLHGFFILSRRALFQLSRMDRIVDQKKQHRPFYERILINFARQNHLQDRMDKEKYFLKIDNLLKKYPYRDSAYNVNAMGAYKLNELFPKTVFGEGTLYRFEDIMIKGPTDYDAYLTQLYGEWKIPSDYSHHSIENISISEKLQEEQLNEKMHNLRDL